MTKFLQFSDILNFSKSVFKSVLQSFHCHFISWLKTLPKLIANKITGELFGCKAFVDVDENLEIAENYSMDKNHQWYKATVSRIVDMDEIPEEIRRRASSSHKIDVTSDLENELVSGY